MYLKKVFILFIVLLVILLAPGCGQPPPETAPEPPSDTLIEESEPELVTTEFEPVVVDLSFSAAPAVNQTAELTLTIDVHPSVVTGMDIYPITKVWIEFERYDPALWYPLGRGQGKDKLLERLSERFDSSDPGDIRLKEKAPFQPESLVPQEAVVVSGNFSWEGPPLIGGDKVRLSANVSFPEAGEWLINAWWEGQDYSPHVREDLKLTIAEDSGRFGWQRDYSIVGSMYPQELYPVDVILKPLSRAPLVGEPFEMTVTVRSIRDVSQAEVFLNIYKEEGYLQVGVHHQVEGDLPWKGSLKKDVSIELSATVAFLEEGDCRISVWSRSSPESRAGNMENIALHVGKENSRFGWPESHDKKYEGLPPPAIPIREEASD